MLIRLNGNDITNEMVKIRRQTWMYYDAGAYVFCLKRSPDDVSLSALNFGEDDISFSLEGKGPSVAGTVAAHPWHFCSYVGRAGIYDGFSNAGLPPFNMTPEGGAWLEWYTKDLDVSAYEGHGDDTFAYSFEEGDFLIEDRSPDTGAQGSPRMVFAEMEHAIAWKMGLPIPTDDLIAWTDRQLDWRGLHNTHFGSGEIRDPRHYTVDTNPHSGREENGVPCNALSKQHPTVTQLAMAAAMTNDPIAWFSLEHHLGAISSLVLNGKIKPTGNSREKGWLFEALNIGHKLMPETSWLTSARHTMRGIVEGHAINGCVNEASRARSDHNYCGVITWMAARCLRAFQLNEEQHGRLFKIVDAARHMAPEEGAWLDDYDLDRSNFHTNPDGSNRTNPYTPWLVTADWWASMQGVETLPGRPLSVGVGEFHPHIKECLRECWDTNNIFRTGDKNAAWPLIIRGLSLGFPLRD